MANENNSGAGAPPAEGGKPAAKSGATPGLKVIALTTLTEPGKGGAPDKEVSRGSYYTARSADEKARLLRIEAVVEDTKENRKKYLDVSDAEEN